MTRILQLTDLHLSASADDLVEGVHTTKTFAAVVAHIKQNLTHRPLPNLLVLTGDISQDYSAASYRLVANSFADLKIPLLIIPGNHDDLTTFNRVFSHPAYHLAGKVLYLRNNWQILPLNSHWEGNVAGLLAASELQFLERSLQKHPEKYAIIFLHHHVVPLGYGIDTLILQNAQKLLEIIGRYNNVKAVFAGHVHQESYFRFNDVDFYTTPATSYQFSPYFPEIMFQDLPPGYRIIDLGEDGHITTEVVRVLLP